jgi:uncharacterized protein (DUF2267 family)
MLLLTPIDSEEDAMTFDEFVGHVQNRAELATTDEALRTIRSTLSTLGERLHGGEAGDLAAQLPHEIGNYIVAADGDEAFSFDTFLRRVASRENVDLPIATYHARVVMEVVDEAVTAGELDDVREQLPAAYQPLFEAGSQGAM